MNAFKDEVLEFDNETGEVKSETPPTSEVERQEQTESVTKSSKRVKRSEREMIADLGGSALKEATYVLDRIAKLEDKISELMGAISQRGRERVIEERPDLAKY